MASIIRIKRSSTAGNPTTLAAGELAYSALTDNGSNGGDRLYIGFGTETAGDAANHYVIGGKYYTDLMSGTAGTLTTNAKSIPILSSSGTIDKWYVGNLYLTGNTLVSTDTNGNINITPNGSGKTVLSNVYIGDTSTTLQEYIYDQVGGTITAGTGITATFSDVGNTTTIAIDSTVATLTGTQTLTNKTISGASNTLTNIGNSSLTNSSVTVNGTSVSLGGSATVTAAAGTLTGTTLNSTVVTSSLTSVGTISSGTWNGTTIAVGYGGTGTATGSITGTGALTFTAGGSNTNVNLVPQGTGTVDVNSKRITSLADPTGAQDAATKAYVDALQTGLDVKASVRVATTANITLSNTQTVDGIALSVGDRVLVKDQSTGSQNGIYVVASGSWTRASDFDNSPGTEVTSGAFTFVEEGTANADSGWVLTTDGTITLGTTSLTFTQFSGAGQITAGSGLTKTGNTLDVQVDNSTLAIVSDTVQIKSTYVGQTSITTLGTIATGTWNGSVIGTAYGGTGVANGSNNTITFTGNYTLGLTLSGNTSVTLPTSGTLATLAGTETFTNKTLTSPTINSGALSGTFTGSHTYSGAVTISNSTASTSTTTGALIVTGGVGIGGTVYVGTNLTGAGASTSTLDGFSIDGGTY